MQVPERLTLHVGVCGKRVRGTSLCASGGIVRRLSEVELSGWPALWLCWRGGRCLWCLSSGVMRSPPVAAISSQCWLTGTSSWVQRPNRPHRVCQATAPHSASHTLRVVALLLPLSVSWSPFNPLSHLFPSTHQDPPWLHFSSLDQVLWFAGHGSLHWWSPVPHCPLVVQS